MAIGYVQGQLFQNGAATTTVPVTISVVGSGNMLIVSLGVSTLLSTDTVTFTDDKGNTYTNAFAAPIIDNVIGYGLMVGYCLNITNGPTVITGTVNNARTNFTIFVDEWSGIVALDVAATGQAQDSPTTGVDVVTSGSMTTVTNGDLIYGVCIDLQGAGVTQGSGFTTLQNTGTFNTHNLIQNTAGPIASTYTALATANNFISAGLAFKAAVTNLMAQIWI